MSSPQKESHPLGAKINPAMGIIIFFLFLCGVGYVINKLTPENKPEETLKDETTQEETKPTVELTKTEKLVVAGQEIMGVGKVEITFDETTGLTTAVLKETTYYDDTSLVRAGYNNLVKFGIEAFKVEGVSEVKIVVKAEFQDLYGKSSVEEAARVAMTKEEFEKYDWNNLKYSNVYTQMITSCSEHYIHPGVWKEVDTSKLLLSY